VANQTSTVTVTSNGIGALSFAILEPASATTKNSATSGVFDSLAAGTIYFKLRIPMVVPQQYYTVDDVVNITVTGQVIKDVVLV
jgi:hypothetical protein